MGHIYTAERKAHRLKHKGIDFQSTNMLFFFRMQKEIINGKIKFQAKEATYKRFPSVRQFLKVQRIKKNHDSKLHF